MKYNTGNPDEYGSLGKFARAIKSPDRAFACTRMDAGKARRVGIACALVVVLLWLSGVLSGGSMDSADVGEIVMIDAGSSGSRVYVYSYALDRDSEDVEIESDAVLKISPGISSYAEHPSAAFTSIEPLLDFAHARVKNPSATYVYLMATAGMRLVAPGPRELIFAAIREGIRKDGRFKFVSDDQVRLISGQEEGAYAWIALNYATNRLYGEASAVQSTDNDDGTCGLVEIGGSSAQVAWEVRFHDMLKVPEQYRFPVDVSLCVALPPSDGRRFPLTGNGRFFLYVTTYLGFGANAAELAYTELLLAEAAAKHQDKAQSVKAIPDPCMMVGQTRIHEERVFVGTGDYDKCRLKLIPVLHTDKTCPNGAPCSFDGQYQPAPPSTRTPLYGLSEVWYCMNDVLHLTTEAYDAAVFDREMTGWCAQLFSEASVKYQSNFWRGADEDRFQRQCFKAAYMSVMLHQGVGLVSSVDIDGDANNDIQIDTVFRAADTIDGVEVEWTLGASLQMLTAELRERPDTATCEV